MGNSYNWILYENRKTRKLLAFDRIERMYDISQSSLDIWRYRNNPASVVVLLGSKKVCHRGMGELSQYDEDNPAFMPKD